MFDNGDEMENYPPNINAIIEKAYLGQARFAEWPEVNEERARVLYRVDFKKMTEFQTDSPDSGEVAVKRKVVGEGRC